MSKKRTPKKISLRNRIKGIREVKASELVVNDLNWREHSEEQESALKAVLELVGFVTGPIVREVDGKLHLVDGHLRRDIGKDELIPVIVTDLTEEEAKIILATFDPISAMADVNDEALRDLIGSIDSDATLEQLLADVGNVYDLGDQGDEVQAPEGFPTVDETIEVEHICPKCGYQFSGGTTIPKADV
jgi:hypothetical protein